MCGMDLYLAQVVGEIERHVAAGGWDQPTRLYALVPTEDVLAAQPGLAESLGITSSAPEDLTPVEQEDLPDSPLEELLSSIQWPAKVVGTAVVVESVALPPAAEQSAPQDGDLAAWAAAQPGREDVRMAVAVLRDGRRECAVRLRSKDSDADVLSGADLVPGLATALAATLQHSLAED